MLQDPVFRAEMHAYIAAVSRNLDCPTLIVGGPTDHIHALARFGKGIAMSAWIKEVKRVSSGFGKKGVPDFAWQAGYGLFSVEFSRLEQMKNYIRNQEEHHRKVSFQDELRQLLREAGVEWDEQYLWD